MIEIIVSIIIILLFGTKIYDIIKKYRESFKTTFRFHAKVVSNDKSRNKGLMNRTKKLKKNYGMLFDFKEPQMINLWMKNTYIPLDTIYFNDDGKIMDLKQNLTPQSTKSVKSNQLCRYVLEVNANTIKNNNIKLGDYIKITKINNF
tara:strand:+ start:204 stop:644 length:441 start_codon:yes stop_codon:yes gene_type:complete